jgi:hypothetical protein
MSRISTIKYEIRISIISIGIVAGAFDLFMLAMIMVQNYPRY